MNENEKVAMRIQHAREEGIIVAVKNLTDAVNGFGVEENVAKLVFEALSCQHRTLQQSFWKTILYTMKIYGEEARTDLRNEASKNACKKISNFVNDLSNEIHLPLI